MRSIPRSGSSGLDVCLLGVIAAGVGFYAGEFTSRSNSIPHLIRFYDKPPGTTYPAVMPQDAALLLLTDPSTPSSTAATGSLAPAGTAWSLLVAVGVLLVVLGPLWSYAFR